MGTRLVKVVGAACLTLFLLPALSVPAFGENRDATVLAPKPFYLSLGDSLAFGFQEGRFDALVNAGTYTPDAFDTGYTDVLTRQMQQLRPGQETVNLSCPGETVRTMVRGACAFTRPDSNGIVLPLHTDYAGSQLDAAVEFLTAHQHQVSPITVAIGANDATQTINICAGREACIERLLLEQRLSTGLDRILGALRTAAPDAEIIVVAAYNPFSINHPETDAVWQRFFTMVEMDAAGRHGARIADVSKIIHGPLRLCTLTFLCMSGDLHPTDLGYRVIGNQIYRVAGFDQP